MRKFVAQKYLHEFFLNEHKANYGMCCKLLTRWSMALFVDIMHERGPE